MINFRFHIVSLTAVLLALGLGLVLGTAFLDDALVNTLRSQLDGLETDLDHERERLAAQGTSLDGLQEEHDMLDEELADHVLSGNLEGEPVLVISDQGVDDALTGRVLDSLGTASADVLGVWQLSGDLNLDDDELVERLAGALDVTTDDADRLRSNVLQQLSDVLYGATDASVSADPDVQSLTGEVAQPEDLEQGDTGERHEPALLEALREADFVEYRFPEDSDAAVVELPAGGLRVVVVDGPDSEVPMSVLMELLEKLASNGPVPVVVTAPGSMDVLDDDETEISPLITELREHDALAERVSTVDNLERMAGNVATVLATEAARPGDPHIGDYGQGEGSEALFPSSDALGRSSE
jgi:hypothetical protein